MDKDFERLIDQVMDENDEALRALAEIEAEEKQAIPEDELANVIQAFDEVDIRKADDAQLNAYMNVAYESYLYAEVLINKRERMRTNK